MLLKRKRTFISLTVNWNWYTPCVNSFSQSPSTLRQINIKTELSLWKRTKCFPSTLSLRNFENATITGYFWGKLGHRNHIFIVTASFSKISIIKMFSVHTRTQSWQFEERFRKAAFSWRISVEGRPNRRNKTVFSNSSDVMWMGPQIYLHLLWHAK